MKVGSIVECVEQPDFCNCDICSRITKPNKGSAYTIRGIIAKGSLLRFSDGTKSVTYADDCVYVEEIVNPVCHPFKDEPPFLMKWFRELLPPMELNIEELIREEQSI